ncbi:MAG: hypothetical protein GC159_18040 [Phycisphaera sp.]|nr:hypothetical protein [Phycisphaera sp.]
MLDRPRKIGNNGTDGAARLWAITCYFNPAGYRRRLENYRTFRRRLALPLITVELSHSGKFDLTPGDDADELIQLHAPDVLWQKERLLNIALSRLPEGCDQVAWLDCDVVFASDAWVAEASAALEKHAVIEPFSEVYELPADADVDDVSPDDAVLRGKSLAYVLERGDAPKDLLRGSIRIKHGCNCGTAWAARRDVLERFGFYDACIIGSGNRAMASAIIGRPDDAVHALRMNPQQAQHFHAWADPYREALNGTLGYIDQTIYHLWHGDLADRRYAERHEQLARFDFDPYRDITLGDDGCWRWNSDKPDMHAYVRHYFEQRREDG